MSGFNRSRRLLISEILEKGLDPTLPYSQLDKKGKLTGVPATKQKKVVEDEEKVVVEITPLQEDQQEITNADPEPTVEIVQTVEYKKVEPEEEVERIDLSSRGDGVEKKVKKNTKKKKDQV